MGAEEGGAGVGLTRVGAQCSFSGAGGKKIATVALIWRVDLEIRGILV